MFDSSCQSLAFYSDFFCLSDAPFTVLDFSAAVNLPRLSPVGRWEMEDAKKLILLSLRQKRERLGTWSELSQSEGEMRVKKGKSV